MKQIIILITLLAPILCWGQHHFVKSIDLDNVSQLGLQLIKVDRSFFIPISSRCNNNESSCGGIIKIDSLGNVLETFLLEGFSNNLSALYLHQDTFYYNGEFYQGSANDFAVLKIDKQLQLVDSFRLKNPDEKFHNYFALSALPFEDHHYIVGTSFTKPTDKGSGHLIKHNGSSQDTAVYYKFADNGSSSVNDILLNTKEEIILIGDFNALEILTDSVIITKLDTNFQIAWEWKHEWQSFRIPKGTVTSNDNIVVTVLNEEWFGLDDIYSISDSGTVNWVYKFPDNHGEINILRIKEARNGDFFVVGQRRAADITDDIRNVAFVMRLSAKGKRKWIRFFRLEDQSTLLSNYIADIYEENNGDLFLVGSTMRTFFDPNLNQERPEQDIFFARIGGDGCINDDCQDIYIITSSQEVISTTYDVQIYPNPIQQNEINVILPKSGKIELYSITGELMLHQKGLKGVNILSVSDLMNGIYIVRSTFEDGGIINSKVVVAR